ncbi:MAG: iron uptake porin [Symploca sp. SIO2B6]|nr:iron uptake porin [Symploca sp. SIO2B6]
MNIRHLLLGISVFVLTTSVVQAESAAETTPDLELSALDASENLPEESQLVNPKVIPELSNWQHLETPNANLPVPTITQLSKKVIVAPVEVSQENGNVPAVNQLSADTPIAQTDDIESPSADSPPQTEIKPLKLVSYSNKWINQVTNVSQLRDVQPGDWAYEALRSLVERYGCIAGYPDGNFRGNRPLTRYEFAAGLNACLEQIERLIADGIDELTLREDLVKLERLTNDFEAELATLATRVDNLEGRVALLEDNQFSTTTILNGEVIFGLATAFGGDPPGGCGFAADSDRVNCQDADGSDTNTVFAHLTRLGLQSSFTGKDRLRLFLTTGNFDNGGFTNPESFNTYMARLAYQADLNNQVILDLLEYRFPAFDDNLVISVIPFGFGLSDVLSANSPYFDTGRGSISRFGQLSPIFNIGGVLDAGAGFDWLISENVRLQVAYGTADSGDPEGGFFSADTSVLGAQLLLQPFENVVTGITYVNAFTSDGRLGTFTGSVNAESNGLWSGGLLPVVDLGLSAPARLGDFPAQTNAVGGTLQWRLTENLTFGAWGGWTFTNFLERLPEFRDPNNNPVNEDDKPFGNTVTYLFSLGLSDPFGREGDLFAFLFGMPPKLVDSGPTTRGQAVPFFEQVVREEDPVEVTDNNPRLDNPGNETFGVEDDATSLHFELFYRFKVNDHLWITPGFFFVTNPGHIEDNDTIFVGTIRTTFRF